ncbi:cytochrome B pre-mRNA-processing protein 6 [Podospora aff. communis PSN243]|uniref:Cytochrome B pre-mRNA-processing protein 6 n=1 Tax=Podospora aff. communis PSN243 TaxID=3040156 RepID=A0AAV9GDE8_9PEZI|nr:cytochrome B pre-mRNA-processing protein 6 [Podospora aff. communis PSN243]
MASAGRTAIASRLQRVLELWPKDPLRPNLQLQDVMAKRLAAGSLAPPRAVYSDQSAKAAAELKQLEALEALPGNKFMRRYPLTARTMQPKSNPTYFNDLLAELEEAPSRSWTTKIAKKLKGMFRAS